MHLRDFTRQSLAAFVKGNQRLNLGILVLFLLASTLPRCQGTGMFEVHFLDYANPGQRDSQSNCCRGQEVQGSCSSPCSTFFNVCLRPLNVKNCALGEKSSDVLGNGSFVIPSNSLLQIPWTVQSWRGSFSLVVTAKHKSVSSSVLIEKAVVTRQNLFPGTLNVSHIGTVANITFSFRVVCRQNYYGDSCRINCVPRDDLNGHYTCDSNGSRVCLPGWTGSFCSTVVCRKGCDPDHGSCSQPNTCTCADGWKGENCTECKTHPACLHGTCNKPWECDCNFGWGGAFCDLDLEYCDRNKPCKNDAMCANVRRGQYACTCKKGYTGRNCETEINECSSNPCLNGGRCTDLIGDYNCSCPVGYSGKQCYPDCVPGACKNGGTCINGIRGFSCTCKTGFSGSSCEVALPTTVPTNLRTSSSSSNSSSHPASHPASTHESTTNGTVDATTTPLTTENETIEESYNSERRPGITKQTTIIISIVVSILLVLILIVACVAWKFWRKRRREAADHVTPRAVESAQVNPKQIDIEDSDPKHCAGARSGNPEIIRNFVSSKQHEKNTNKTQDNLADEKILQGKALKENAKTSLELSDITTTTKTTTPTSESRTTTRMNLDELYLPNRCYDQGFWQEVELEI